MQRTRCGSVHFLFSTGKMCKFYSRSLFNRQLNQFPSIPVEFVVRSKLCESNYTFYGCLVSAFNIFIQLMFTRSQRVQWQSCTQRAFYHSITDIKPFHFSGKFQFLVRTITDSVRLGVVNLNLVLSTGRGTQRTFF